MACFRERWATTLKGWKTTEKGCCFHIKLLEASVGKKTAPKALIKSYKKFILLIGDSRMNHF